MISNLSNILILSEISFKGISFGKLSPVHLLKQHFELFRVLSDFFCKIKIPASLARTVPEPFPINPLKLTPGAMQDKHSKRKARVSGPLRGLFKFKNKIEIKVHADYNNSCKLQKNRVFYNKIKYRTFFSMIGWETVLALTRGKTLLYIRILQNQHIQNTRVSVRSNTIVLQTLPTTPIHLKKKLCLTGGLLTSTISACPSNLQKFHFSSN